MVLTSPNTSVGICRNKESFAGFLDFRSFTNKYAVEEIAIVNTQKTHPISWEQNLNLREHLLNLLPCEAGISVLVSASVRCGKRNDDNEVSQPQ